MANPLGACMSFALVGPTPPPQQQDPHAARLRFAPFAPRTRFAPRARTPGPLPTPPPLETPRELLLGAVLDHLARCVEGASFVELVSALAAPRPMLKCVLKAALRRGHVRRVGSHAAMRYLRNHPEAARR